MSGWKGDREGVSFLKIKIYHVENCFDLSDQLSSGEIAFQQIEIRVRVHVHVRVRIRIRIRSQGERCVFVFIFAFAFIAAEKYVFVSVFAVVVVDSCRRFDREGNNIRIRIRIRCDGERLVFVSTST